MAPHRHQRLVSYIKAEEPAGLRGGTSRACIVLFVKIMVKLGREAWKWQHEKRAKHRRDRRGGVRYCAVRSSFSVHVSQYPIGTS